MLYKYKTYMRCVDVYNIRGKRQKQIMWNDIREIDFFHLFPVKTLRLLLITFGTLGIDQTLRKPFIFSFVCAYITSTYEILPFSLLFLPFFRTRIFFLRQCSQCLAFSLHEVIFLNYPFYVYVRVIKKNCVGCL